MDLGGYLRRFECRLVGGKMGKLEIRHASLQREVLVVVIVGFVDLGERMGR